MQSMELVQRAYTETLLGLLRHGRAPHYVELASVLKVPVEEARRLQRAAAEYSNREGAAACWMASDTDYVEAWAPFSSLPTHHRLTIDGREGFYGQ
jgi:hypothetical protein